MVRIKYSKNNSDKTPIHLLKYKKKIRMEDIAKKHGKTYENGCFFINKKEITKYDPKKENNSSFNGCYFNKRTGRFEILKDGRKLSSMPWKIGQRILIEWHNKFFNTGIK